MGMSWQPAHIIGQVRRCQRGRKLSRRFPVHVWGTSHLHPGAYVEGRVENTENRGCVPEDDLIFDETQGKRVVFTLEKQWQILF